MVKSCLPISRCAAACIAVAVERARHAPGAVLIERQIGAAIDDAIEIMALDRREARIEIRRDLLGREHRDRLRPQMEIDRVAHLVDVPILGEIDMRDLAERMHAGIGASGADDRDALAGKSRDRFGEHALHRDAIVLRLPADKGRAVIFDGELVAGHARSAQHGAAGDRRAAQKFIRLHRLPPARCNSTIRTAPSPQAIVSLSSSTRARLRLGRRLWWCATP